MVLVLCGDFEPEKELEKVKKHLLDSKVNGEIKIIYEEEPEEIYAKRKEKQMEVSIPLFIIGYKVKKEEKNIIKQHIAIEILLNIIMGKSSKLYKKLYEEGLIQTPPDLDFEFAENYAHIVIGGQSKKPDELLKCLNEEITCLKNNGLQEDDFSRIKKKIYGDYIREYNEVGDIARMLLSEYIKGINSFEYLENFTNVTKEYTEQVLKEVFDENKQVISIGKPK